MPRDPNGNHSNWVREGGLYDAGRGVPWSSASQVSEVLGSE